MKIKFIFSKTPPNVSLAKNKHNPKRVDIIINTILSEHKLMLVFIHSIYLPAVGLEN